MMMSELPEPEPRCENCGGRGGMSYKGWRIMCIDCISAAEDF